MLLLYPETLSIIPPPFFLVYPSSRSVVVGLIIRLLVIPFSLLLGLQAASVEISTTTAETPQRDVQKIQYRSRIWRRAVRHERRIRHVASRAELHPREEAISSAGANDVVNADVQPIQVLVEAAIIQVKLNKDVGDSGIDFAMFDGAWEKIDGTAHDAMIGSNPTLALAARGKEVRGSAKEPNGMKFGWFSGDTVGLIQALQSKGETKVLAYPRLLVLNKQRAEIHLGDRLSYKTSTVNQTGTIEKVESIEIGTKMRMRPFVVADGKIRLEVRVEHSTGCLDDLGVPQVDTVGVTSNLIMPDGATVAMSGPIHNEVAQNREAPSILSGVPYIGGLFSSTDDVVTREQTIVVLTSRIWTPKTLESLTAGNATTVR